MIRVNVKNPKKQLKFLERLSKGMSIAKIAREVDMDRFIIKRIHELVGDNKIYQRKLGRVRLCILKG